MTFQNTGEDADEADGISLTEQRTFEVIVPIGGIELGDLAKDVEAGKVEWTLSRDHGIRDDKDFPCNQNLGGRLVDFNTVATKDQPAIDFFTDIKTSAVEVNGKPALKLSFSNNTMYGYDGIDGRSRAIVRNSILDDTGTFTLACSVNGKQAGKLPVEVRPYDSYCTQEEVDAEPPSLPRRPRRTACTPRWSRSAPPPRAVPSTPSS